MPLIACPECAAQVSSQATACPNCGKRLRRPRRSPIGSLIKGSFIAFNLVMIWWFGGYVVEWADRFDQASSEAARTGTAIGGTMASGMILTIWTMGVIILGVATLLTRPRQ